MAANREVPEITASQTSASYSSLGLTPEPTKCHRPASSSSSATRTSSDRSRRAGVLVIVPEPAFEEITLPPTSPVACFPERDIWPSRRLETSASRACYRQLGSPKCLADKRLVT